MIDLYYFLKYVLYLISLISAFLFPVIIVIYVMLFLVSTDCITGIIASWLNGEKITSRRMSETVGKLIGYFITILLAYILQVYVLNNLLPVVNAVSIFLSILESYSILENIDRATHKRIRLFGILMKILKAGEGFFYRKIIDTLKRKSKED